MAWTDPGQQAVKTHPVMSAIGVSAWLDVSAEKNIDHTFEFKVNGINPLITSSVIVRAEGRVSSGTPTDPVRIKLFYHTY